MDNMSQLVITDLTKNNVLFEYDGKPARVTFLYTTHRSPGNGWLESAIKEDVLKYQLDGAIRTLAPKGREITIYVVDIVSPTVIPNIQLYFSEHGNWHIGKPGQGLQAEELRALNPDHVSYYQSKSYFLALKSCCEVGHDADVGQYILYVHKK